MRHAALVPRVDAREHVHARRADAAERLHRRGRAEPVDGKKHLVDADVEQRAARLLETVDGVIGRHRRRRTAGAHERDLADRIALEMRAQLPVQRIERRLHRLHEEAFRRVRSVEHGFGSRAR
nr:hypothetical protein [Burkholderia thailandensis]